MRKIIPIELNFDSFLIAYDSYLFLMILACSEAMKGSIPYFMVL